MSNDTRLKNVNWAAGDNGQAPTWERVQVALLMDIRDELQALNRVMQCHNTQRIPRVLDVIALNTRRPKKKRRSKP